MKNEKSTSWGGVANWYDDYLGKSDTYQEKVILPNLLRLLGNGKSEVIVDLGCGQGYFSRETAKLGKMVIGIDISESLIERAKSFKTPNVTYFISEAGKKWPIKDKSVDKVISILAIQNIKDINNVLYESHRVIKNNGKLLMVLNHPAFRVPKSSDWIYDGKKGEQGRIVFEYMSERRVEIIMNPGAMNSKGSPKTYSFHRPLQSYFKLLAKNSFAVSRLEEWISHKESRKGPRKGAEDKARKEIPLFMMIEARIVESL